MEIINSQYINASENRIVLAEMQKDAKYNYNGFVVSTYDIDEKRVLNSFTINAHDFVKVIFVDDNAIVLSRRTISDGDLAGWDMIVTSFNCLTGEMYYQKEYYDSDAEDIVVTFSEEGEGTMLVNASREVYLLDFNTGDKRVSYSFASHVSYMQPIKGTYRVFTSGGSVNTISGKSTSYYDNINLIGPFNFNLSNYVQFLYASGKYIAFPGKANRIIIYGNINNEDIKETEYNKEDSTYKDSNTNDLTYSDLNPIKEEYNFEHKDLISVAFYTDDKKLLFVGYNYNTLEIYNNETKELLKTIEKMMEIPNSFICKTESNEYILNTVEGGYIFDKNLDPIAYIPGLENYKDGKFILNDWGDYYEVKKYTSKEIIERAKAYLETKED